MEEEGRVSVSELARRLGVSEVTIRKDLAALEAEQRLIRTHGGAIAAERTQAELAFDIRERQQRAEKQAIGAAAAAMVVPAESIALDASTTALQVARRLRKIRELTVMTNGLNIAAELATEPRITVLVPGGRVRWEAFSLVGAYGDTLVSRINIQRAFLGAVGFTLDTGLTEVTEEEAAIKRAIVGSAREVVAVIDHTKWGRVGIATFATVDEIDLIITDTSAPIDMVEAARARGIDVMQAAPLDQSSATGGAATARLAGDLRARQRSTLRRRATT